jgi:hypothetical protein
MTEQTNVEGIPLTQPKWPLEDSIPSLYANHFSIVRTPHEVVLVFGEFIPTGLSNRSKDEIQSYLETATVRPISKIVISYAGAKALFAIMKENLEKMAQEERETGTND